MAPAERSGQPGKSLTARPGQAFPPTSRECQTEPDLSQGDIQNVESAFRKTWRIGRITLNRPEDMNAIDDEVPALLSEPVATANRDPGIHLIVLSGNGAAFSAGYDLAFYAEGEGRGQATEDMPWGPMKKFALMSRNSDHFMSLWRSHKPVICKLHGHAVAGGSDVALCADLIVIAEDARIGYMPARVRGCPIAAM